MSKIWEPKNYKKSNLYRFESFLKKEFKKSFLEYSEMHNWSINQPDQFWLAISKFFKIEFSKSYKSVLIHDLPVPFILDMSIFFSSAIFLAAGLNISDFESSESVSGLTSRFFSEISETVGFSLEIPSASVSI